MTFVRRSPTTEPADASNPYAHRFGASPPLSLGVEEELLLVDARHELTPVSETVLGSVSAAVAERISSEIFADQIELKTGICHGVGEVLDELRETRGAIRKSGFELLGSGLHPAADLGEARLVDYLAERTRRR